MSPLWRVSPGPVRPHPRPLVTPLVHHHHHHPNLFEQAWINPQQRVRPGCPVVVASCFGIVLCEDQFTESVRIYDSGPPRSFGSHKKLVNFVANYYSLVDQHVSLTITSMTPWYLYSFGTLPKSRITPLYKKNPNKNWLTSNAGVENIAVDTWRCKSSFQLLRWQILTPTQRTDFLLSSLDRTWRQSYCCFIGNSVRRARSIVTVDSVLQRIMIKPGRLPSVLDDPQGPLQPHGRPNVVVRALK